MSLIHIFLPHLFLPPLANLPWNTLPRIPRRFGEDTTLRLWWSKCPEVLKSTATVQPTSIQKCCAYPETTKQINQTFSCHLESTMNHLTFIHSSNSMDFSFFRFFPSNISLLKVPPFDIQVDHHDLRQETFQHDESRAECQHWGFPQSFTGAFSVLGTTTELHAGVVWGEVDSWFANSWLKRREWRKFYRNPKLPLFQVMCFVEGGSMETSDLWGFLSGLIFFSTRPQVTSANNISAKWIADLYWTSWFKTEWIFVANFSFTLWWKWHNSHKKWLSNLGNL